MPRIGLISDTHSFLDDKVFKHFDNCDQIWHAGDFGSMEVSEKLSNFKPFKGVYGNIDHQEIRLLHPLDQVFDLEGKKIWMRHIIGSPTRYHKGIPELMKDIQPDIVICGHSHILKVMQDQKHHCLHINPGAAGRHGFHKVRTLIKFDINDSTLSNMQVIELGPRTEKFTQR